jgi:hypothetical protein
VTKCPRWRWAGVTALAITVAWAVFFVPDPAATGDKPTQPGGFRVEVVHVDGRDVTCVVYIGGGISCDWDPQPTPPAWPPSEIA